MTITISKKHEGVIYEKRIGFFVLAAIIALLLNLYFHLPIAFFYVLLGLWIGIALFITLGLGVLSKGTPRPDYQKNINPYSKSTKDFLKKDSDDNKNQ